MDRLDGKLRLAEEMSEDAESEKKDGQTLGGKANKANAGDGKGTCVASSQANSDCTCRVCDFVAKTPTALKIHCKRKHGSRTPPTDQAGTTVPPTDQAGTTVPPTDQAGTTVPPTDQAGTTVPPTDQAGTTVPPADQTGTTVPPADQSGTTVPPADQSGTTVPPTVHPTTTTDHPDAAPPSYTEHLISVVSDTDQSSLTAPPTDPPGTETLERLHCRCCSFYTCTLEEMYAHLSEEAHRKCATEKNMDPQFDGCVEKLLVIILDGQKGGGEAGEPAGGADEDTAVNESDEEGQSPEQTSSELGTEAKAPLKRKRGRPKSSQVTSCSHCGLVASNPTNLSVHIRRKHSRLYGFHCKVCKYSCVTKGDMDRHCETKKHVKRVQSEGDGQDVVVSLDAEQAPQGTEGEDAGREAPALKTEGEAEGTGSEVPSKKGRYDGNSCVHCDFVAHSALSLDLHIRRKHTKSFEFVCLACSYYAVTRKEMSRHTATEKHKQKRSRYLQKRRTSPERPADPQPAPEGTEAGNPNVAKESNSDKLDEDSKGAKDEPEKGDEEEDDDDVEEDTTTPGSPSAETPLFQAAQFDECVFSLKVQTDGLQEGNEPEPNGAPAKTRDRPEQEANSRVRCDDCGFLAEGLGGLNVHITMKHPSKEKRFHCLLCGKSFFSDSSLQQHLSSSTHLRTEHGSVDERPDGGSAFRCVRCNEPCASEQDLFVHIKEKHEELLREVNKYVLEDTEQINRERQENPGNVCKYCGKVCKSSNSIAFLAHIRTHTGSKPFMCKICNFATAQLGDARTHVKRHLGMREYKCHLCGWAFVMKKHLNTHLLGKHGLGQPKDRKYECELCDRSFIEKWALNNHMKLHTGDKPFKCSWPSCHYAFLTLSAMKDHYRTHTGEKSFLCDLCGFAGGTRHALTKHRRQHTGERPFRCNLCSFASTTQSHLTRHKRVHTGEKPYRCPWCDYRSNCAENIRKHILHTGKHEGVMMYNCPRCDYCTNTPSEFRNHLKEEHQDIENPDLAYLHAGIVSKSFECRLKGQGSAYVEADAPFMPEEGRLGAETLQQVIIIQGYGDEEELQGAEQEKAELEESAAATLQTLAMSSSVNGELLQVTQDGRVVPYVPKNYVLVDSGPGQGAQGAGQTSQVTEQESTGPSTALDALLCAVSELDQQGGAAREEVGAAGGRQGEGQETVQVYEEVVQVLGHTHQEVLQYAASQLMMREGLTQVIVNDEGTHYIVTEVTEHSLQEDGAVEAGLGGETESKAQE